MPTSARILKHALAVALSLAVLPAGLARADEGDKDKENKDKADVLFKAGKQLMADKHYAEACDAFEQSFKLDPEIGSQLNTAHCYEEWGQLARAFAGYQVAEQMAKTVNDPRLPKIHALVSAIDPQVPRLTLVVPAGVDGRTMEASVDDGAVPVTELGQARPVDPGSHTITFNANGVRKKKIVRLERAGISEISLDPGAPPAVPPPVVAPVAPVAPTGEPGQLPLWKQPRMQAYVVGGAGVALIGVASYMTLSARSRYNDALQHDCGNSTMNCDPAGLSTTHDARHEANVATFVFSAGVLALGGGVALYLWPHDPRDAHAGDQTHALYVAPSVSTTGGALVFGGKL